MELTDDTWHLVKHTSKVTGFVGDQTANLKLFDDIGPRYEDRPGGYTRIVKLGPRLARAAFPPPGPGRYVPR